MEVYYIYAIAGAIFAALATIFAKIGLEQIDPLVVTLLRSLVILLFAIILVFIFDKYSIINNLESKDIIYIILSGIMGALSWIFFFFALQKGSAINVSIIDRSSVLFVSIFSILFLGENLNLRNGIALALILIALYLLAI